MIRRADERAVTVQIGAVLLLAIVFSALALYQINAVPAENERVEITHNEQVHGELQDLRNAIQNVGTDGGTQSTSVTLGTQYSSRTLTTNPSAPTGSLETTGTANMSIDNAAFAGDRGTYDGDPDALLGDHETTTLTYRPDYNEYDSAPTTRIEHGFAFNDFGAAQVSLTDQPVVSDGTIRLVVLEGELAESGSGAVTLDPTVLSGPSDEVPIERDGSENITVSVPTAAPTAWNETIGTAFDDGESGVRAAAYDDGNGTLTLELAEEEYDLQVARVGVGDSSGTDDRYDVSGAGSESGASPAYRVHWQDPSGQSGVDDENCDASSCRVTGDHVDLEMATDETAADAAVEYAVSDRSVGTVSPNDGRTNDDGTHGTTFDVDSDAEDGDTVSVYTSSGSDGDRISLEISREPYFDVTIADTNDPVEEGETLEVDVDVENTGADGSERTIAVELTDEDGTVVTDEEWTVSLESGGTDSRTVEWETSDGDAGEYTADIESEDDTDSEDVRVVEERATLEIDAVEGLGDGSSDASYEASVTVSETDGVETDGLASRLVITDEDGEPAYDDRKVAGEEIEGESTTIEFDDIGSLEAGEYEYTVTVDAENAGAVETDGSFTVSDGANLESAEGWAESAHHQQGLEEVGFEWELSEPADLELRILDSEDGNVVGTETITDAETTSDAVVEVTDGSNQGGDTEEFPVWLEVEVVDTGETCGSELAEDDGRITLCE